MIDVRCWLHHNYEMRLLLLEDNALQREALTSGLVSSGYVVDVCEDGEDALSRALNNSYDLLILDIMVPKITGLEVLRRLRAADKKVPILLLTARDGVEDRVEGLDCGADDYVTKPFAFSELLARVRANIRRQHQNPKPMLTVGELMLDNIGRVVKNYGQEIILTPREFSVLELLMLRAGSVVTRIELCQHIYEFSSDPDSNALDVFISRLRRKLTIPGKGIPIQTRRGQGYKLSLTRASIA